MDKEKKVKRAKTYSTKALLRAVFEEWPLSDVLKAILGEVEGKGFSVHVYGESGHGKSALVALLLVEFAKWLKVYMNNTESGFGGVLKKAAIRAGLTEDMPIYWGDNHSIQEMISVCLKNRSTVIGLDSVQDANLTYEEFQRIIKLFKKRVVITIGWAEGKQPLGADAKAILYKSDVKIRVHEGVAYIRSRFGSVKPFKIPGVYEHFQQLKAEEKALKSGIPATPVEQERERKLQTP